MMAHRFIDGLPIYRWFYPSPKWYNVRPPSDVNVGLDWPQ